MAFVRKKNKNFKWPVVVREPSETNAGEYAENEFVAIFARLTRTEYAKLGEKDELESLKQILKGWEGLNEEDGTPVKYSTNNFINNILACISTMFVLNLNLSKMKKNFIGFKIPEGRGDIKMVKKFSKRFKFIDESLSLIHI